ncbi:MAG: SCP2 sterol-binding domain-containing protein [Candidatus Lokiarchaeota archaeon]|nr:SCP2 sterol-binding domain-containing protein [Candidatus Lokiarchaeota archaeon]
MLDSKKFNSVIHELENKEEEFIAILDKIIKMGVNFLQNTEELREEIMDYDYIYQILVSDINFKFWLKVSRGSIMYKRGINPNATFRVSYTKDIMIKILKREMYGSEAYMKGIIKVDGDLTQGLRYIKVFRLLLKYIKNNFKNE